MRYMSSKINLVRTTIPEGWRYNRYPYKRPDPMHLVRIHNLSTQLATVPVIYKHFLLHWKSEHRIINAR